MYNRSSNEPYLLSPCRLRQRAQRLTRKHPLDPCNSYKLFCDLQGTNPALYSFHQDMGCLISIPKKKKKKDYRQSHGGFAVSPSKSMFPRWDTIRSLSGTLKLKGGNRAPLLAVTLRKLVRVSHFSSVWNLSYLSIALSFHPLGARTVNSFIHLTRPGIWVSPPVGFICFKARTEPIFLRHENIGGFFLDALSALLH